MSRLAKVRSLHEGAIRGIIPALLTQIEQRTRPQMTGEPHMLVAPEPAASVV